MSAKCPCGRVWTGLGECHCAACHRHFSAIGPFDRHRVNGECVDPATVVRKDGNPAFMATERASGTVWLAWESDERRAAYKTAVR